MNDGLHATDIPVRCILFSSLIHIPSSSRADPSCAMLWIYRRFKSARYLTAAFAAILVVSTLYYIQIPVPPHLRSSEDFGGPWFSPPKPFQTQRPVVAASPIWDQRAAQVKQMYQHAYGGYRKYAAGYDELRPVSNTAQNKCVH